MATMTLPPDFIHEHDNIAQSKVWPELGRLNNRWFKLDEHTDGLHAGILSGKGSEVENNLAARLLPCPGMDKRATYTEAVWSDLEIKF